MKNNLLHIGGLAIFFVFLAWGATQYKVRHTNYAPIITDTPSKEVEQLAEAVGLLDEIKEMRAELSSKNVIVDEPIIVDNDSSNRAALWLAANVEEDFDLDTIILQIWDYSNFQDEYEEFKAQLESDPYSMELITKYQQAFAEFVVNVGVWPWEHTFDILLPSQIEPCTCAEHGGIAIRENAEWFALAKNYEELEYQVFALIPENRRVQ